MKWREENQPDSEDWGGNRENRERQVLLPEGVGPETLSRGSLQGYTGRT